MTALIIVVRDPDSSNEFRTFGDEVMIVDIDAGYMNLSDPAEYGEWRQGHLAEADVLEADGQTEAAKFIREVVDSYAPARWAEA